MQAGLSLFLTVSRLILMLVARRSVVPILTEDLNRCLKAVSLMSLPWAGVVDFGRTDLGPSFVEPGLANLVLILNTVALVTPACLAA